MRGTNLAVFSLPTIPALLAVTIARVYDAMPRAVVVVRKDTHHAFPFVTALGTMVSFEIALTDATSVVVHVGLSTVLTRFQTRPLALLSDPRCDAHGTMGRSIKVRVARTLSVGWHRVAMPMTCLLARPETLDADKPVLALFAALSSKVPVARALAVVVHLASSSSRARVLVRKPAIVLLFAEMTVCTDAARAIAAPVGVARAAAALRVYLSMAVAIEGV
jgi:hypothetical protein